MRPRVITWPFGNLGKRLCDAVELVKLNISWIASPEGIMTTFQRVRRASAISSILRLAWNGVCPAEVCNMLVDAVQGRFHMATSDICKIAFAVTYLVCTFDGIPDYIPVVGLLDDVTVLGYASDVVTRNIQRYRQLEHEGRFQQQEHEDQFS